MNNQSGGTAAETPKINPNLEIPINSHHTEVINQDDIPGPLKPIAERFQCNLDTLKKNVKCNKLPALQKDPKAPYLAKPSDVEKLLRTTPGIASIFHPKTVTTFTTGESHTQAADDSQPTPRSMEDGGVVHADEVRSALNPATEAVKGGGPAGGTETIIEKSNNDQLGLPKPKESEDKQTAAAKKPRRRRRRGKGGTGQQHAPIATPHILKSLAGISTEKRLFITAFLSELTSLVASA